FAPGTDPARFAEHSSYRAFTDRYARSNGSDRLGQEMTDTLSSRRLTPTFLADDSPETLVLVIPMPGAIIIVRLELGGNGAPRPHSDPPTVIRAAAADPATAGNNGDAAPAAPRESAGGSLGAAAPAPGAAAASPLARTGLPSQTAF